MRIGIIGIGDICKKAYLPLLTQRKDTELILCTRNDTVLKEVMDQYHLTQGVHTLDELIDLKPAAIFITSATHAHFKMAKQCLEAGIPVHLDKPMSLNYEESQALTNLADQKNVFLGIGFNRRFVPLVKRVHDLGVPDLVIYQKNRSIGTDEIRRFIVEDFIHVVDTSRYLLQNEIVDMRVQAKKDGENLHHVVVQFITASNSALCIMNYQNGITEEVIEVMHPYKKSVIKNLASYEVYEQASHQIELPNDWNPTLKKRGFVDMIQAFYDQLEGTKNSCVRAQDALITHELVERIVKIIEAQ